MYAKAPFAGPEQLFAYLGRYTHRVAITNHRILQFADGQVTFAYRDYADGNRKKQLTVSGAEFLRRFLLHVLPRGFVRLRHYGLHAPSNLATKLAKAKALLTTSPAAAPEPTPETCQRAVVPHTPRRSELPLRETWSETLRRHTGIDVRACPRCRSGRLMRHEQLAPIGMARSPPVAS